MTERDETIVERTFHNVLNANGEPLRLRGPKWAMDEVRIHRLRDVPEVTEIPRDESRRPHIQPSTDLLLLGRGMLAGSVGVWTTDSKWHALGVAVCLLGINQINDTLHGRRR